MNRYHNVQLVSETGAKCAQCGRDLSSTTNSEGHCIAMLNVAIPPVGGAVTDMADPPKLERDYYFCDVGCLERFYGVSKNNPDRAGDVMQNKVI
jgi:hypothetical protein